MDSIWSKTCEIPGREPLRGELKTRAVVIGAGMAGVLIASALQEAGIKTAVLEADRIAGGQSRNTTAKITAQHGLIYRRLMDDFGPEKAGQYARANLRAVETYRRLIHERGIDCDFQEQRAYLYGDSRNQLEAEAAAARTLGLPAAFVEAPELPISAAGAVAFSGQGQFHPLKFIRAMAKGLEIYEHSPVKEIDGNRLTCPEGRVEAEHIIFACHYPFVNFPGMYFARMHQERSYVLALEVERPLDGMWISAEEGGYSLRNYGGLQFIGGENHRTGENREGGRYDWLRRKAEELFPGSREAAHWSAQDCMSADGIPYIGRFSQERPGWYVATGFNKWGMSSSMVSAMLIRDMILGKENSDGEVFDPGRFDVETLSAVVAEGAQAVKGLTKRFFQIPSEAAAEIAPGQGGIVFLKGEKLGAYRDKEGKLHAVDIRCPHLGCQLEWNSDELSWDCPCHGSRFDAYGKLISGPAQENIAGK